jgi:hypothetical protein
VCYPFSPPTALFLSPNLFHLVLSSAPTLCHILSVLACSCISILKRRHVFFYQKQAVLPFSEMQMYQPAVLDLCTLLTRMPKAELHARTLCGRYVRLKLRLSLTGAPPLSTPRARILHAFWIVLHRNCIRLRKDSLRSMDGLTLDGGMIQSVASARARRENKRGTDLNRIVSFSTEIGAHVEGSQERVRINFKIS